jgi:hypothetical protein
MSNGGIMKKLIVFMVFISITISAFAEQIMFMREVRGYNEYIIFTDKLSDGFFAVFNVSEGSIFYYEFGKSDAGKLKSTSAKNNGKPAYTNTPYEKTNDYLIINGQRYELKICNDLADILLNELP